MAVKKGLGKGLDSLITDKVNTKPAASKIIQHQRVSTRRCYHDEYHKGRTKQGAAEKKIR